MEFAINNHSVTTLLLSVLPFSETAPRSYLVVLHDISNYKLLEAEVLKRKSLAMVGEAITSINHELKNIMQPLKYAFERMLRDPDPAAVQRAATVVPDRFALLERLVASLREISRPIELRLRDVDLGELVQSVWRDVSELPEAAGVAFTVNLPNDCRSVALDPHWMRIVLFNLMRNAVEAMNGSKERTLSFNSMLSEGQTILTLKDSGCGMDDNARSQLFSMFYSTKGQSGTGLGLALVKKIIDLHGGSIFVESAPGMGTTSTSRCPLQ